MTPRWLQVMLATCCLYVAVIHAQTDDAQHSDQEAAARQKLDQVRVEIHKISDAQKETNGKKNTTVVALRDQELQVAAAAKELRAIDQKLVVQQAKLDKLQAQRNALNEKLKTQRDALATLLRSAYVMGRNQELKLLLAQNSVVSIEHLFAYYHYFEHARVNEIEALLKDIDALAQVQQAIEHETAALQSMRAERVIQAQQLDAERVQRAQLLGEINAALKDQQSRLAALGKDEKELLALIEKLRDVFADIPGQIAGAEPFAQQRGHLLWPAHGKLETVFGASDDSGRPSQGILITAPTGTEVRAVSHGRVAFADWLRGFGLLLIVDHGDGYLSLYGYNEALLKDVGDWVNANEVIATSGASGGRKMPGVYFELRYQGKPLDPRNWLKQNSR